MLKEVSSMEKKVKWMTQYTRLFVRALKKMGRADYKKLENQFRNRYMDYLCSDEFEENRKYGTLPLEKIYAAITIVKICSESGISMEEIQKLWKEIHSGEQWRKDILNNLTGSSKSYGKLVNKLDIEAGKHKANESMTFETLERKEDYFEVKINRCAYVEILEKHGIKTFCKEFCDNDCCFGSACKITKCEKYSNLVEGNDCHMKFVKGE